jgi:hypothetical protein
VQTRVGHPGPDRVNRELRAPIGDKQHSGRIYVIIWQNLFTESCTRRLISSRNSS